MQSLKIFFLAKELDVIDSYKHFLIHEYFREVLVELIDELISILS